MKEKLHQFHVAILVFMTQTGVVLFHIPQIEAQYFGTNGYLCIPILSAVVMLNIGLIAVVYKLGKGKSMFDILEQSIPKWILAPFYLALSAGWVALGALVAKEYLYIFQMVAFPTTNPMVFEFAYEILAFFLILKGIYNIAKAATMFFWLIIWMNLLLFFFYGDFEFTRLTPFLFKDGQSIKEGLAVMYTAFLGYELVLLLFPYADSRTKLMKAAVWGNIILTLNYLYVSFISFGFFSLEQLKLLLFPLLDLMAYIKFPFMERIENIFYGFFIFSVMTTTVMYTWSAKEACTRIVPRLNQKWLAFFLVLAGYAYTFFPDVLSEVQGALSILGYIETGVAFALPVLLIVILCIQRRKGGAAHG